MYLTAENKQDKYAVIEVLELDQEHFIEYREDMRKNAIKYTEQITPNTNEHPLLLVVGNDGEDGVIVDFSEQGRNLVPVFIPDALPQLESFIKTVADYCIEQGIMNTKSEEWKISCEELCRHFDNTNITKNNLFGKYLENILEQSDEVVFVMFSDKSIEIQYDMEYCNKNTAEKIPLKVKDLMRCELSSIHLCHIDEDHDLATIEDLNVNTLTEAGKKAWSDVLNARVTSIYSGYYGIQIGVDGCDVERVKDFSYMLAGHCLSEDYDKWVNSESDAPKSEPEMRGAE